MEPMRLHEEQIDVPDAVVTSMIQSQCPQWAHLELTRVPSGGTVHRVDFLGSDMVVRVPIIEEGAHEARADGDRLPALASALAPSGIVVPEMLHVGSPAAGVPWSWGVYVRLAGRHPDPASTTDQRALVEGLSAAIQAMWSNPSLRALGTRSPAMVDYETDSAHTRPRVVALESRAALAAWDAAVELAARDADPSLTWIHGDLLPGNLLVEDDGPGSSPRLTGMLDWGASGIGDAALDLLPAWACMGADARRDFLDAVEATPEQVVRARAYAVRKAAWGIPYYAHTLPGFAASLEFALSQVEADDP